MVAQYSISLFDKNSWKLVTVYDATQPMQVSSIAPLLSVPNVAIRIRTSLSTNGAFLAAFNAMAGFDVYDLNDGKVLGSFTREPMDNEVPIVFILDGQVVISGSARGVLNIWCINQSRQLELLRMPSTLLLPCN